ncbi:MAG TPA: helix-turn-helix transcriptional regulator, partial [Solirubrobacterales bacterium]
MYCLHTLAGVDLSVAFGRNVARCRKRAGLSQGELGARASLHPTAIGLIERGERTARIDTLVKIAGALEVPPGDLFEGLGWKPGTRTSGEFYVEP